MWMYDDDMYMNEYETHILMICKKLGNKKGERCVIIDDDKYSAHFEPQWKQIISDFLFII